jgi:hypothetical protein
MKKRYPRRQEPASLGARPEKYRLTCTPDDQNIEPEGLWQGRQSIPTA